MKQYLYTKKLPTFSYGGLSKMGELGNEAATGYNNNFKDKENNNELLNSGVGAGAILGTIGLNSIDKYNQTDVLGNQRQVESKWGTAGKGALQGAMVGSTLGPIGAGVGAVAGGAYGYLSNNEQQLADQQIQDARRIKGSMLLDQSNQRLNQLKQTGYNPTGNQYTKMFGEGGKIHIKPSHRGRFTEYKKRTGETTEEALHSKNAHVRKMAQFAKNASHWKHSEGDYIKKYPNGGKTQPVIVNNLNDPRLKAYNDSLDLYNRATEELKFHGPSVGKLIPYKDVPEESPVGFQDIDHNVFDSNLKSKIFNKTIKPIGFYPIDQGRPLHAAYKKPIQPVVYQPKSVNKYKWSGYTFIDATGLKNGNYTQEEVDSAMKARNKYPNLKSKVNGDLGQLYAKGGEINNPDYEIENNEVVKGNNVQLEGNQKDLASDMTKGIGATHEEGGIKGKGGEKVFSDRLVITPQFHSSLSAKGIKVKQDSTYAKVAEILGKKKGMFEEKSKSSNLLSNTTGKTMLSKIDGLIDSTFNEQETMKKYTEDKQFKYGGNLKKMWAGGKNPYDPFNEADKYAEYENNNKSVVNNTLKSEPSTSFLDVKRNIGNNLAGFNQMQEPNTNNFPHISDNYVDNNTPTSIPNSNNDVPTSRTPNRFKSFLGKIGENPEQVANGLLYLNNLNNIDKQKTNISRTTPTPNYVTGTNYLPQNLASIDSTVRSADTNIDQNTANSQNAYAKKADIISRAISGKNEAVRNQSEIDNNINNKNSEISNQFNLIKANNANEDLIDKYQGENAKSDKRINATNGFLQGIMGNIASKRNYAVDKTKLAIAGMDAGRGTTYRSAKQLLETGNVDPETKKYLQSIIDKRDRGFAYGGKIKAGMKKYC